MRPIYDSLSKYIKDDIYPFHMPGHKMGRGTYFEIDSRYDISPEHMRCST